MSSTHITIIILTIFENSTSKSIFSKHHDLMACRFWYLVGNSCNFYHTWSWTVCLKSPITTTHHIDFGKTQNRYNGLPALLHELENQNNWSNKNRISLKLFIHTQFKRTPRIVWLIIYDCASSYIYSTDVHSINVSKKNVRLS